MRNDDRLPVNELDRLTVSPEKPENIGAGISAPSSSPPSRGPDVWIMKSVRSASIWM